MYETAKFVLPVDSPVRLQLKKEEQGKVYFKKLTDLFEFFSQLLDDRSLNECPEKCLDFIQNSRFSMSVEPDILSVHKSEYMQIRISSERGIRRRLFTQSFVGEARETIKESRAAMFRSFESSPSLKQVYREDPDWEKGPWEEKEWYLARESQTCTLDRAAAVITNGSLYVVAEVTNHPVYEHLKFPKRQTINEYISRDLNSSMVTIHPMYDYNTNDYSYSHESMAKGTTVITRSGGSIPLSWSGRFGSNFNLAVQEAYKKNVLNVNPALVAVNPSSIAILALPLVMNLIPGAVLGDVNAWAIVVYIMTTDVFSCIPFIIKGIELLIVAENENNEYLVVDREGSKELSYIQIFIASCHESMDFQYTGNVFVIVGVMAGIFGVALELLAIHLVKRRRIKKLADRV